MASVSMHAFVLEQSSSCVHLCAAFCRMRLLAVSHAPVLTTPSCGGGSTQCSCLVEAKLRACILWSVALTKHACRHCPWPQPFNTGAHPMSLASAAMQELETRP